MTNILITGIDGFLGRSLEGYVRKYRLPYNVYGIDSALKGPTKKKFKINVKNKETVKGIIKELKPRYIYHFAGNSRSSDFNDLMKANVVCSRVLLEAVLELKVKGIRVIVPGSAAEYGQPKPESMPIQETAEPTPVTKYGFSKMYQVLLALGYQQKGLDILIGRIFNICGWGVPQTFALGKFARDITLIKQHKKKIVIETKGLNCKRDFLDIEDVCAALLILAERGKGGEVYNICSGRSYRIGKLLDQLLYIAKCKGIKITTVASASPRIEDIYGSNKKIKIHTGWQPKISIRESLKNILNYYGALQGKP